MKRKVHLIIIDPQRDFCEKTGALFVPGADEDMRRLASFITRNQRRIDDISCTLDSHQSVHVAHPIFWVNSKGQRPNPFTVITADDVRKGVWRAFNPAWQTRAQAYVDALEKDTPDHPKRYALVIWPPHCLIGSLGHSLFPDMEKALYDWETGTFSRVNFVAKGSNFFTEHYSAVMADVPDPKDSSTKLNTALIDTLADADVDEILCAGEALSHCMANTFRDIANNFGPDNVKKMTLLTDASSNVPGFENLGKDFVKEMTARGMKVSTTRDW